MNQFIRDEALEKIALVWPRYRLKVPVDLADITELLSIVCDPAYRVSNMPDEWPPASPDRDDDPFLWAALQGKAEYIISHDRRHMLDLGSFRDIPIGTTTQFFEWVKIKHPMETPGI